MSSFISQNIGERIRYYRKAAGFTLVSFADALHRGKSVVSKYERGEISIDIETLHQITEILNVPISLLIEDSNRTIDTWVSRVPGAPSDEEYQLLYMYMYATHQGKPQLSRNTIHLSNDHAYVYAELPDVTQIKSYKSFYSGEIQRESSFVRGLLVNPLNSHDLAIFEYQPPLNQYACFMGFFCTLSIGRYFPLATKALFSWAPVCDEDWLVEKLRITAPDSKDYRNLNGFFVTSGVSLYQPK